MVNNIKKINNVLKKLKYMGYISNCVCFILTIIDTTSKKYHWYFEVSNLSILLKIIGDP